MLKECRHHGLTNFALEGRGWYRCKKCRSEAVSRRRREIKRQSVEYLGGKCVRCGYDKSIWALDFHHRENKSFRLGNGHSRSWEDQKRELDKCDLLCANCHRELHHSEYD